MVISFSARQCLQQPFSQISASNFPPHASNSISQTRPDSVKHQVYSKAISPKFCFQIHQLSLYPPRQEFPHPSKNKYIFLRNFYNTCLAGRGGSLEGQCPRTLMQVSCRWFYNSSWDNVPFNMLGVARMVLAWANHAWPDWLSSLQRDDWPCEWGESSGRCSRWPCQGVWSATAHS